MTVKRFKKRIINFITTMNVQNFTSIPKLMRTRNMMSEDPSHQKNARFLGDVIRLGKPCFSEIKA